MMHWTGRQRAGFATVLVGGVVGVAGAWLGGPGLVVAAASFLGLLGFVVVLTLDSRRRDATERAHIRHLLRRSVKFDEQGLRLEAEIKDGSERLDFVTSRLAEHERRVISRLERSTLEIVDILRELKSWEVDLEDTRAAKEAEAVREIKVLRNLVVARIDEVERRLNASFETRILLCLDALTEIAENASSETTNLLAELESLRSAANEAEDEFQALRALVRGQPAARTALLQRIDHLQSDLADSLDVTFTSRPDVARDRQVTVEQQGTVVPVPVRDIPSGGHQLPIVRTARWQDFVPVSGEGGSRYASNLGNGTSLDSLLVNRGGGTLLVALHGATNRSKYTLPRFEWLDTIKSTEFSALFVSDPTLFSDPRLTLAWYSGWRGLDLRPVIAEHVRRAASAVGADRVLFFGSSGGGFAAIQLAAALPASTALAFNPQVAFARYRGGGTDTSAQRKYVEAVMPHLAPRGFKALVPGSDWSEPLGDRASLLRLFDRRVRSRVLYVQNTADEWHYTDHYLPFRQHVEAGPNSAQVRFREYVGGVQHDPPRRSLLLASIEDALAWDENL